MFAALSVRLRGPGRGLSLSVSLSRLSAGSSTRHVYARSMPAASRDPYRSVSRSVHWLAILESGVLLVHTGALRDRCAPRWGLRCVSTWAWTTRLPVGSAPPAIGSFGRPRRLRARAFDRAHMSSISLSSISQSSSPASPPSSQASCRRAPRAPRELGTNAAADRARPQRAQPRRADATSRCASAGGHAHRAHVARAMSRARRPCLARPRQRASRERRASRHRLWARRSLNSMSPHGMNRGASALAW